MMQPSDLIKTAVTRFMKEVAKGTLSPEALQRGLKTFRTGEVRGLHKGMSKAQPGYLGEGFEHRVFKGLTREGPAAVKVRKPGQGLQGTLGSKEYSEVTQAYPEIFGKAIPHSRGYAQEMLSPLDPKALQDPAMKSKIDALLGRLSAGEGPYQARYRGIQQGLRETVPGAYQYPYFIGGVASPRGGHQLLVKDIKLPNIMMRGDQPVLSDALLMPIKGARKQPFEQYLTSYENMLAGQGRVGDIQRAYDLVSGTPLR